MARRPAGCLGWIGLLVVGIAVLGSFNHREDVDVSHRTTADQPSVSQEIAVGSPAPLLGMPSAARFVPRTLYVTASSLNVRASPVASASILVTAPQGTPVVAVGQTDGWYEVRLTNGNTGWMSGEYLSSTPPQMETRAVEAASAAPVKKAYDRASVVAAIIALSISSYSGRCPCPYNTMRNGRSCGGNSAYSRPGGRSPVCYPRDVTQAMIDDYLARH
jgi:SH3-like domain-containing protein